MPCVPGILKALVVGNRSLIIDLLSCLAITADSINQDTVVHAMKKQIKWRVSK